MKVKTNALKIHLALFTVAAIYAGNYTIAKWVMPEFMGPFGFILLRVFFGAVIFWLFYRLFAYEPIKERKHYFQLAVAGLFGVALNMLAFFKGLSMTSPINASVLMLFAPVFVVVLSSILYKKKMSWVTYLGIIVSFVGAAFLVGIQQFKFENQGSLGDLLVVFNALSYGFYLVYVSDLLKQYKATTITAYIFLFGLCFVLPFGWKEVMLVEWSKLPPFAWRSIAYVIACTTVIAYFLNSWGVQKSSSTLVGAYVYLQPVLATVIALLFGLDKLSLEKAIFAAVIILGVYLVNNSRK